MSSIVARLGGCFDIREKCYQELSVRVESC